MELKQHHNYVAIFVDGRIKIGRTGNIKRRLQELRRQSGRLLGYIEGEPVSARVALHTETHIRRALRGHALPGHCEWFFGPRREAAVVADFTRRTQITLEQVGL